MATKEEISIVASSGREKYDEVVKQNLHFPKLIAPILKAIVPEYKKYSVEEVTNFIIKNSIKDDPIDDVSAMAQMETEMSSISEKLIRYDSRFKAINPELSNEKINFYLHIDLEVQNNYKPTNPKYPIIKRALYYGAREISSQLGILTNSTDYNSLEKVYSIWICNENVPKNLQNTISSYSIVKTDKIGKCDEPVSDYDLMNVIIIRRGDKNIDEEIFDYLTGFFTSDIKTICKYVDISNDEEVKKGVNEMTGLGNSLYKKGILDNLVSLVEKGLLKIQDAADEADMSESEFEKLLKMNNFKKELEKKQKK